MSGLFGNFSSDPRMQRHALMSKYNAARINLIAVVVFTAINMITLTTNVGSYFLFSANMPYMLTFLGLFLCGMMPENYYEKAEEMVFMDKSLFVVMLVISILILLLYMACWWFSKNGKVAWIRIALGLFVIDTVAMFLLGSAGIFIVDLIFHIWVIGILVSALNAFKKIKALPKDNEMIEADFTELDADEYYEHEEKDFAGEIEAPTETINEKKVEE